jgi:hypothetical protein
MYVNTTTLPRYVFSSSFFFLLSSSFFLLNKMSTCCECFHYNATYADSIENDIYLPFLFKVPVRVSNMVPDVPLVVSSTIGSTPAAPSLPPGAAVSLQTFVRRDRPLVVIAGSGS